MAHTQTAGRHLMVQRQFKKLGIPRMYRSSGTDDPRTLSQINEMLTALADAASPDAVELLKALDSGRRSFLEVLPTHRKRGLEGLEKLAKDAPLDPDDFGRWLEGHTGAATTRASYKANFNTLSSWATLRERQVSDLPAILARYREDCVKKGTRFRAWNYALAVSKAWVRATLGPDSETYAKLRRLRNLTVPKTHRSNAYFTPRAIKNMMQRLPDEVADMLWTMTVHGMGPKEYLLDGCAIEGHSLRIFGQKNRNRDRLVPLIVPPAPICVKNYKRLLNLVKKASEGTVPKDVVLRPYDLRRSFKRWMAHAGVPKERIEMYMGHTPQTQTDEYGFYDTEEFRVADAKLLKAWMETELAKEPPIDFPKLAMGRARRGTLNSEAFRPEMAAKSRRLPKQIRKSDKSIKSANR